MSGVDVTPDGLAEVAPITADELAKRAGFNAGTLGKKLKGKVPFTYAEMDRVLAALDLSWGWLVTGEVDNHPNYPLSSQGKVLAKASDQREPSHYKGLAGESNPNLFSLGCGNARGVRFQQTLRQSPVKLQVSALRRAAHSVHLTHSHTSPINLVAV